MIYTANLASLFVSRNQPPTNYYSSYGANRLLCNMTDVNHTITLGMRMCIDQGLYRKTYTRHMYPQSIPLLIPVKMTLDGNIDTFMLLLEDWCEVMIDTNRNSTQEAYCIMKSFQSLIPVQNV